MLPTNEFQAVLWRELQAAELVLDPVRYQICRGEVSRWGATERDQVVSLVGDRTWRRALACLKRDHPEEDCIRVLGFGRALTEFAVAPLELPDVTREGVVSLGALANFIVAIYDHTVDLRTSRGTVLPRWMLKATAQRERQLWLWVLASVRPAASRMVMRLVSDYFRRLALMPYSGKHTHVIQAVKRAVIRMYDAEADTLRHDRSLVSECMLRRKSALPFVVMGLPAWLGLPEVCKKRYRWYLGWLYRLGDFFGWIDDVVDVDEDLPTRQPNRVVNRRARLVGEETDVELARSIACRGRRIVVEWHREVENLTDLPITVREALRTCMVSWFGGLQRLTSQ